MLVLFLSENPVCHVLCLHMRMRVGFASCFLNAFGIALFNCLLGAAPILRLHLVPDLYGWEWAKM
jgi:hypothetical protein